MVRNLSAKPFALASLSMAAGGLFFATPARAEFEIKEFSDREG